MQYALDNWAIVVDELEDLYSQLNDNKLKTKFFNEKNDLDSLDLVSAWLMKAPFKSVKDGDVLTTLHKLTHVESD